MSLQRLDKILTDSGVCSRSTAKDKIKQGLVQVNGSVVTDPALKFDTSVCTVSVDGDSINSQAHIYIMLNKPTGLLSASKDPRQPTVLDLMPVIWRRRGIFCVGRLDKDTTGLLLLTDDGEFAHRIISPKNHIPKLYEAEVDGVPTESDITAFREGIVLKDGLHCLPAELEITGPHTVRVTVFEGKYHQVKRMLGSRLLTVTALKRLSIGPLKLDEDLDSGDFRELSLEEFNTLSEILMSK